MKIYNGFAHTQVRLAESAKRCFMLAAGLLAFAALPIFASPITFSECPAVGDDTTGCALLITVTATNGMGTATAFTVTASGGPTSYDGGDGTLIGVLNSPSDSGGVFGINFTVAPGRGTFAFDEKGACEATGSPLVDIYSPAPTAAQCLQGQYQTEDDGSILGTKYYSVPRPSPRSRARGTSAPTSRSGCQKARCVSLSCRPRFRMR